MEGFSIGRALAEVIGFRDPTLGDRFGEIEQCPNCGGARKIVVVIEAPAMIAAAAPIEAQEDK